jgi:nucleoside-diphosphate-sugar epimerase
VKIILPGGAGLVGQNLIIQLKNKGYKDITVIDKHQSNAHILEELHPDINIIVADLGVNGKWSEQFKDADVVVMLQAQIGSNNSDLFHQNNIASSHNVLDSMKLYSVPYLIHISSSVVESISEDDYTLTKKSQENLVLKSGIDNVILRPSLMFGWFDRKHLGWLARLMKKIPVFPIPGDGKFMRQPLFAKDFCDIIISCIEKKIIGEVYNITGLQKINYIDIILNIRRTINSKTRVLKIPYRLFYFLLWCWALFDKNPPFTTTQLVSLVASDEFEIIDWPIIFNVSATPFSEAIKVTFNDSKYSKTTLNF